MEATGIVASGMLRELELLLAPVLRTSTTFGPTTLVRFEVRCAPA
jgi:hypothetical protein